MNTLSELSAKTKEQLIREMRPADVLDLATEAYFKYRKLRTEQSCEEYNWWVDVYNFKRGKRVLKSQTYHPIAIGRFEKHYGEDQSRNF